MKIKHNFKIGDTLPLSKEPIKYHHYHWKEYVYDNGFYLGLSTTNFSSTTITGFITYNNIDCVILESIYIPISEIFRVFPQFKLKNQNTMKKGDLLSQYVDPTKKYQGYINDNGTFTKRGFYNNDIFSSDRYIDKIVGNGKYFHLEGDFDLCFKVSDFTSKPKVKSSNKQKILGYKLKPEFSNMNQYVQDITGYTTFDFNCGDERSMHHVSKGTDCYNKLIKLKLLNAWFEPIYKEVEFNVGDWVVFLPEKADKPYLNPCWDRNMTLQIDEIDRNTLHFEDQSYPHFPALSMLNLSKFFRFATKNEIETRKQMFTSKPFKLSNGKTVKFTKEGFIAEGVNIKIETLKNVLDIKMKQYGWDITPTEYQIGCWERVTRKDLNNIVSEYNKLKRYL